MAAVPNLGTLVAQAEKYVPPIVSTRGHAEESDIPKAPDPWLTKPRNALGYDVIGDVPGFNDKTSPKEIVIYVHGWNNNEDTAKKNFNLFQEALGKKSKNLAKNVIGFSWDSNTGMGDYGDAKKIAKLNGPKLAQFILDYHSESENTKIRIVGHSLGSQVILNAIQHLHNNQESTDKIITTVDFVGASVNDGAIAMTPGGFGKAISKVVGQLNNYYNRDDPALDLYYLVEKDQKALGDEGVKTKIILPPNYNQYDVTSKVKYSHNAYNKAIVDIVNNWNISNSKKVENIDNKDLSNMQKNNEIDDLLAKGHKFRDSGDYGKAITYYKKALLIDPKNFVALENLGNIYYNKIGNWVYAKKYYEQALLIDPKNSKISDYLSRISGFNSEINYQENEQKNEQKNKEFNDLVSKGDNFRDKGQYHDAENYYKQALQINPADSNVLYSLGDIYEKLEDYENAIKYYNKALKINPNHIRAAFSAGYIYYFKIENLDQGRYYYEMALKIDPKNSYVLDTLGEIYEDLGDYEKAMKYYDRALESDPNYKYAKEHKKALQEKIKSPKISTPTEPQTAARDLTSNWEGTMTWSSVDLTEEFRPNNCEYSGKVSLLLSQNGNVLGGIVSYPELVESTHNEICNILTSGLTFSVINANVFGTGFSGTLGKLNADGQFTTDFLRVEISGTLDVGGIPVNEIHGQFTTQRVN